MESSFRKELLPIKYGESIYQQIVRLAHRSIDNNDEKLTDYIIDTAPYYQKFENQIPAIDMREKSLALSVENLITQDTNSSDYLFLVDKHGSLRIGERSLLIHCLTVNTSQENYLPSKELNGITTWTDLQHRSYRILPYGKDLAGLFHEAGQLAMYKKHIINILKKLENKPTSPGVKAYQQPLSLLLENFSKEYLCSLGILNPATLSSFSCDHSLFVTSTEQDIIDGIESQEAKNRIFMTYVDHGRYHTNLTQEGKHICMTRSNNKLYIRYYLIKRLLVSNTKQLLMILSS